MALLNTDTTNTSLKFGANFATKINDTNYCLIRGVQSGFLYLRRAVNYGFVGTIANDEGGQTSTHWLCLSMVFEVEWKPDIYLPARTYNGRPS